MGKSSTKGDEEVGASATSVADQIPGLIEELQQAVGMDKSKTPPAYSLAIGQRNAFEILKLWHEARNGTYPQFDQSFSLAQKIDKLVNSLIGEAVPKTEKQFYTEEVDNPDNPGQMVKQQRTRVVKVGMVTKEELTKEFCEILRVMIQKAEADDILWDNIPEWMDVVLPEVSKASLMWDYQKYRNLLQQRVAALKAQRAQQQSQWIRGTLVAARVDADQLKLGEIQALLRKLEADKQQLELDKRQLETDKGTLTTQQQTLARELIKRNAEADAFEIAAKHWESEFDAMSVYAGSMAGSVYDGGSMLGADENSECVFDVRNKVDNKIKLSSGDACVFPAEFFEIAAIFETCFQPKEKKTALADSMQSGGVHFAEPRNPKRWDLERRLPAQLRPLYHSLYLQDRSLADIVQNILTLANDTQFSNALGAEPAKKYTARFQALVRLLKSYQENHTLSKEALEWQAGELSRNDLALDAGASQDDKRARLVVLEKAQRYASTFDYLMADLVTPDGWLFRDIPGSRALQLKFANLGPRITEAEIAEIETLKVACSASVATPASQ